MKKEGDRVITEMLVKWVGLPKDESGWELLGGLRPITHTLWARCFERWEIVRDQSAQEERPKED